MNSRERAEIELGIQDVDAFTTSFRPRGIDVPPAIPKEELEPAQVLFTNTFENTPGITQIEPSKFFVAKIKDRSVRREYFRPTPQEDEEFKFVPQALCEIGLIKGRFGLNIEWRQDANFRRDSLTIFPFDDEMKLRLKPGEELSVDWMHGQVSDIELKTHILVDGKPQLHNTFSSWNFFREAKNKGDVNFWQSDWTRRFQVDVDLDYLRADGELRGEIDEFMDLLTGRDTALGDYHYAPIDMLHLERKRDEDEISIRKTDPRETENGSEAGISIQRYSSDQQDKCLDDIFIPDPFNVLALVATVFPRDLLRSPENSPLVQDRDWLNQHSIVRELIGLKWIRRYADELTERVSPFRTNWDE